MGGRGKKKAFRYGRDVSSIFIFSISSVFFFLQCRISASYFELVRFDGRQRGVIKVSECAKTSKETRKDADSCMLRDKYATR